MNRSVPLDRNLRERLVFDLRLILEKSQQTALYVTHDQEEAFVIADRVMIMHAGRIAQIGTPQQIYRRPSCRFVANFLGLSNQVKGIVVVNNGQPMVRTSIGDFPLNDWKQPEEVDRLITSRYCSPRTGWRAQTVGQSGGCHLSGQRF